MSATPFPTLDNIAFYKAKNEIGIDLATEVGLGVMKRQKDYLLYCPFISEEPTSIVYEMLFLKVYVQLLHPEENWYETKYFYRRAKEYEQSQ
ncbi:hypothetical protein ACFYU8_14840 [Brevibacillus sp. NPDC003359]|uniref:hypothetical protein n=1 Tax=unclassified Brevibacillus TaxID=2684853 RepID=UPI003695AFD9